VSSKNGRPPQRLEPAMVAGRVPPHDLDAEAAVLSAILLSREALDRVQEILRPEYFYSDANGRIYEAAQQLALAGTPIDIISVASWLRDRERLAQIGGPSYLAQLADATPAVAHVGAHAAVVYEKWRVRQLIATCQKIAAEGYGDVGIVQEFIDSAEHAIYEIARTGSRVAVERLSLVLRRAFEQVTKAAERGDRITGYSTGYTKLDAKTAGLHPGDLTIVAARPGMGKTAFVCNVGVNLASPREMTHGTQEGTPITIIEPGYGVVIFSLEMPREQLAMRMICSESRVDLGRLRQGYLQPQDWRLLTESASYLSSLPIWIDDTPAISLLELRAKVRRIQAEYNRDPEPADKEAGKEAQNERKVGLVVVDYLQLMKGRDGVTSREQEISEISRGLKQLAKELKVPVIALSQLNRAVETRKTTDGKRPQLSDLRECMVGATRIYDPATGALVALRDRPRRAVGLGGAMRIAPSPIVDVWSTGTKRIYRLTTASGRQIRGTLNHPLRTFRAWTPLGDIKPGDRIAVPRVLPAPKRPTNRLGPAELRLLGYLISDGHYGKNRSVGYVKADRALVADVRAIARQLFGVRAKPHRCPGKASQIELTVPRCGPRGNPLINWLREVGVHGQLGHDKRFPSAVWTCDNARLAIFLGALWAGDGSVVRRKQGGWVLKFPSTSMGLLDDIGWALLRLGILFSRGSPERNEKSTRDIATISISESDQIARFARLVPMIGAKGRRLRRAAAACRTCGRNARHDRLPIEVTAVVRERARAKAVSWARLGYRCQNKTMCRGDLARVANVLEDEELLALAESDVLWDEVISVQSDGEEETYDLRAPATANVVADWVFAHNSGAIEQDADLIIFIYRDEYYNAETTNAKGIAELIIAKQRNGPTGKVMTRFTASCTRFDNIMAGDYPEETEE
jgi:replicative DNA helicase